MKVTLLPTCRIGLFTAFVAAIFPGAGVAGAAGAGLWGGNQFVFRLSSNPLAASRGG